MDKTTNTVGLQCHGCGALLKISTSRSNRGEQTVCRRCYRKRWYKANELGVKQQSKEYYQRTRERRLEVARRWQANNRQKHREDARIRKLRVKYGVTPEWYEETLAKQGGLCFLCRNGSRENKRLSIDHDTKTGLVRALLCEVCNRALGVLERDHGWTERAIDYLVAWKLKHTLP